MEMAQMYPELELFIGNRKISPHERPCSEVYNPADGKVLGIRPNAEEGDIDEAVDQAKLAFIEWSTRSPYERAKIIHSATDRMRAEVDYLARLVTLEQGKPLGEARIEIHNAADMFDWFAEEGRRSYGRTIPARGHGQNMTVRYEPVGVVAGMAAWNVPALTMSRKVGAALAAGCTIVYKPAEETPATPLALAEMLYSAGLPRAALSVVFGDPQRISQRIMSSNDVRKITFTGSTAVGRKLAEMASSDIKRLTMELGGHAPVIIWNDVDPERVATSAVKAKFRNAGQICTSPTRFYIHADIYESFVSAMGNAARQITVGNGLDSDTNMGPLANPRRVEAIESLVDDARAKGARLIYGGRRIDRPGNYFQPTILADVPDSAKIMSEEPFGPIAVCNPIGDLDEALEKANNLPFGLASYAFTNTLAVARALESGVEAGNVCINNWIVSTPETPFGGVRHSGYGSEGGTEGLREFLKLKFVHEWDGEAV